MGRVVPNRGDDRHASRADKGWDVGGHEVSDRKDGRWRSGKVADVSARAPGP